MKLTYLFYFSLCCCLSVFLTFSPGHGNEISQEQKDSIDEMFLVFSGDRMNNVFQEVFLNQLSVAIVQQNPQMNHETFLIVEEELETFLHEELSKEGSLQSAVYPIYNKYLSLEEMQQILHFYRTPTARKMVDVMGRVSRESMQAGQEWLNSLVPQLRERLLTRMEQEGVEVD